MTLQCLAIDCSIKTLVSKSAGCACISIVCLNTFPRFFYDVPEMVHPSVQADGSSSSPRHRCSPQRLCISPLLWLSLLDIHSLSTPSAAPSVYNVVLTMWLHLHVPSLNGKYSKLRHIALHSAPCLLQGNMLSSGLHSHGKSTFALISSIR